LNSEKHGGYDDWRLPTLEEATSLMEAKKHGDLYLDPVFNHKQRWIWTADRYSASAAWVVGFRSGGGCYFDRVDSNGSVRAVRGGQSNI